MDVILSLPNEVSSLVVKSSKPSMSQGFTETGFGFLQAFDDRAHAVTFSMRSMMAWLA